MNFDYDPATRHLPQTDLHRIDEFDAEADRVRCEFGWSLASFIGLFDADRQWICLVQLGYSTEKFGGAHPWCMPGGAVLPHELPSTAVIRELHEETGLVVSKADLRPAGWFARPYFRTHHRPDHPGELLLLFAAFANPDDPNLRANPPETIQAVFAPFDLQKFLSIPVSGEGDVPFQPLAGRHWAWWSRAAQMALEDQFREPAVWTYDSREKMIGPPWPVLPTLPAWFTDENPIRPAPLKPSSKST